MITAKLENHKIQIEVSDPGCGIDPEDIQKILDQFYRAKNKHRKGSHAGPGLSIVRRILELHGESVNVSREPGKGAGFSFSISVFGAG